MIEAGAAVRFACERCRQLFDVDLKAIELIRGRGFSLVNQKARCKLSSCRGLGRFVAREGADSQFQLLDDTTAFDSTPGWVLRFEDSDDDGPDPPATAMRRSA